MINNKTFTVVIIICAILMCIYTLAFIAPAFAGEIIETELDEIFSEPEQILEVEEILEPEVEIEERPELSVYIWAEPKKDVYEIGEVVTFYSTIVNKEYYEDYEFQYQWQISDDCIIWEDLEEETYETCILPVLKEYENKYFRLIVNYR